MYNAIKSAEANMSYTMWITDVFVAFLVVSIVTVKASDQFRIDAKGLILWH